MVVQPIHISVFLYLIWVLNLTLHSVMAVCTQGFQTSVRALEGEHAGGRGEHTRFAGISAAAAGPMQSVPIWIDFFCPELTAIAKKRDVINENWGVGLSKKSKKYDIEGFFSAKGISTNCESCGRNAWHIFEEMGTLRQAQGMSRIIGERYIPTIMMACTNCGHVRQYVFAVYDQWQKSKD